MVGGVFIEWAALVQNQLHFFGNAQSGQGGALFGQGIAGQAPGQGFRRGGLMATYLTGPLLVLNPPFTKALLHELGEPETLAFEQAAMDAYQARLEEFRDEKRSYMY